MSPHRVLLSAFLVALVANAAAQENNRGNNGGNNGGRPLGFLFDDVALTRKVERRPSPCHAPAATRFGTA